METEAKLHVQYLMRTGVLEYVWSDMLVVEAGDCPIIDQREKILSWRHGASVFVEITAEIERNAGLIMDLGVKTGDALHLACAAYAKCDWFFTVDRGILKKVNNIGAMRVANPLRYIEENRI
ncbi:MAG: PIN domain-containing protein [Kiritimatiellae bacterium]|nr:PIN domain-containing protein [Kiritimatiellia bacterium]